MAGAAAVEWTAVVHPLVLGACSAPELCGATSGVLQARAEPGSREQSWSSAGKVAAGDSSTRYIQDLETFGCLTHSGPENEEVPVIEDAREEGGTKLKWMPITSTRHNS